MNDLIVHPCHALIKMGPGEIGNQCPVVCDKPAIEYIGEHWYCVQHLAELDTEEGVWTYFKRCDFCGGSHGKG